MDDPYSSVNLTKEVLANLRQIPEGSFKIATKKS